MHSFYTHYRGHLRTIGIHLAICSILYFLDFYYFIPRLARDNSDVIQRLSLISWLTELATFYGLGYVVFPRYLYTRRIRHLIALIGVVYYIHYLINYFSFQWIQPYSDGYSHAHESYVERIWVQILRPYGLLGCFTNIPTTLWNYAYSLFIPTILLFFKAVSDIILYRNRAFRLERDKLESDRKQLLLEKNNLTLELDFLRSQINPHFLFNTLNSLYVRVIDLDDEAAEIVLKLSDLMRYNLYESNVDRIGITKELDFIENYLALERVRHGQRVDISYEATGNFLHHSIAPLLLISLVENAFKHGASKSREKAFVRVEAHLQDSCFTFRVINSVPPAVSSPSHSTTGGVGIVNTRKRLDLLYPQKHHLTLTPDEHLFTAELTLNL